MIIANVKPGEYLIIDQLTVIARVNRIYKVEFGFTIPDGYSIVNVFNHTSQKIKTLSELANLYDFSNYPGYNAILKDRNVYKANSRANQALRRKRWRLSP
jgi:hypothetical protein